MGNVILIWNETGFGQQEEPSGLSFETLFTNIKGSLGQDLVPGIAPENKASKQKTERCSDYGL